MGSPAAPCTNPVTRCRDPGRRQAAPGRTRLMTTQGRTVRQDTARQGCTTANTQNTPAGRHRPTGPQPCPQKPARPLITARNIYPAANISHYDQQRSSTHGCGLDKFPVAMVPAETPGLGSYCISLTGRRLKRAGNGRPLRRSAIRPSPTCQRTPRCSYTHASAGNFRLKVGSRQGQEHRPAENPGHEQVGEANQHER
jgi:hypothetical protein